MVSSISSKKTERKQVDLRYHSSKVDFVRSFLGRNVGLKKSFRLCLTFRKNDRNSVIPKTRKWMKNALFEPTTLPEYNLQPPEFFQSEIFHSLVLCFNLIRNIRILSAIKEKFFETTILHNFLFSSNRLGKGPYINDVSSEGEGGKKHRHLLSKKRTKGEGGGSWNRKWAVVVYGCPLTGFHHTTAKILFFVGGELDILKEFFLGCSMSTHERKVSTNKQKPTT